MLKVFIHLFVRIFFLVVFYFLGLLPFLQFIYDLLGISNPSFIFADSLADSVDGISEGDVEQPFYKKVGFWVSVGVITIIVGLVAYVYLSQSDIPPSAPSTPAPSSAPVTEIDTGSRLLPTTNTFSDFESPTSFNITPSDSLDYGNTFKSTPSEITTLPHVQSGIQLGRAEDVLARRFGVPVLTSDIRRNPLLFNIFLRQLQEAKGMNDTAFHEWMNSREGFIAFARSAGLEEPMF